jgi:hypothetical protein
VGGQRQRFFPNCDLHSQLNGECGPMANQRSGVRSERAGSRLDSGLGPSIPTTARSTSVDANWCRAWRSTPNFFRLAALPHSHRQSVVTPVDYDRPACPPPVLGCQRAATDSAGSTTSKNIL